MAGDPAGRRLKFPDALLDRLDCEVRLLLAHEAGLSIVHRLPPFVSVAAPLLGVELFFLNGLVSSNECSVHGLLGSGQSVHDSLVLLRRSLRVPLVTLGSLLRVPL